MKKIIPIAAVLAMISMFVLGYLTGAGRPQPAAASPAITFDGGNVQLPANYCVKIDKTDNAVTFSLVDLRTSNYSVCSLDPDNIKVVNWNFSLK